MKITFVKITPCIVTFCTSNHVYQIIENLDLEKYPLTTLPNRTDIGIKSHFITPGIVSFLVFLF